MLLDNNGKLSAVKNTVDTKIARYQNSVGTAQLVTVWYNPDFDPATPPFYHVRVLQIPTLRHSLYDALAMKMESAENFPDTSY